MNVVALTEAAVRRDPGATAISFGDRVLSRADLQAAAARFGSALRARGLRTGDRVALFGRNSPELVVALAGAMRAGLVAVPINGKLSHVELSQILADCSARALVHGPGAADVVARVLPDAALDVVAQVGEEGPGEPFAELLDAGDPGAPIEDVEPDDVAWLFYTSGTTGRSKGACLSHRNLTAMTIGMLADVCAYRAEDRVLHVAPLTHGSGLFLLGALARGAENVIDDRVGFDPVAVLELVERRAITVIAFLAPTMIVRLLDARPAADTSSLRCVIYGGAPIHVDHARRMLDRFGQVFVQIYGQGEAPMTIAWKPAEDHGAELLDAAGWCRSGVEIRIVDEHDRPVDAGLVGEVCVRGDVVMRGYWRNDAATRRALVDGWLHTGDIGRLDDAGRLFLLDRADDMIISGGTNIHPREVEEVLLQHAGVAEAVVFGLPDPEWGQRVAAAVVARPGVAMTADELVAFCRPRLASFKKPTRVAFVDDLPKNAYGKVLRRVVRDAMLEAAPAG